MLLPKSLMALIFGSFLADCPKECFNLKSSSFIRCSLSILTILYWFSQPCNTPLHQARSSLLSYSANFSLIIVSIICYSMALFFGLYSSWIFFIWLLYHFSWLFSLSFFVWLSTYPHYPQVVLISEWTFHVVYSFLCSCLYNFHLWNISVLFSNSFLSPVNSLFTIFYWLVTLFLSF